MQSGPDVFNVLLVDAEGPALGTGVWRHLRTRDRWENPGADETQCHLMVQMMEAWLVADRERLAEYYGENCHEKALPDNPTSNGSISRHWKGPWPRRLAIPRRDAITRPATPRISSRGSAPMSFA